MLPAAPAFEPPDETGRARIEPILHAEPDAPTAPRHTEPELPMPGLTPAPPNPEPAAPAEPPPASAQGIAPEDDLFAAPEPPPEAHAPEPAAEAAPALRPGLDAADTAEPERKPERTVVGRHASGGNTYVMYDDGSIEADTPQGRFTFASLDELKAFVDGGGEAGARGAA